MMKKYWLILESYVFVWFNEKHILIYNTLSTKGELLKNSLILQPLIKQLCNKDNLYCTTITDADLCIPDIKHFVWYLRRKYCVNLYEQSEFPQKPIVFIPDVNINDDLSREETFSYNPHIFGINILKNLTDLTFYITGECELNCTYCEEIYKQCISCYKNSSVLSVEVIESFLKQAEYSNVSNINIVGGNIFTYPYLLELLDLFNRYTYEYTFYISYSLFIDEKYKHFVSKISSYPIKSKYIVQFDCSYTPIENFSCSQVVNISEYQFLIYNETDYNMCADILNKYDFSGRLIPIYVKNNLDFFQSCVYLDLEDILKIKWKKNQIFSNKNVNTNYFGKLFITSTGEVYSNQNSYKLGDNQVELKKIVCDEIKNGENWRLLRKYFTPCKDCILCEICPPISNYELRINKYDLCAVVLD